MDMIQWFASEHPYTLLTIVSVIALTTLCYGLHRLEKGLLIRSALALVICSGVLMAPFRLLSLDNPHIRDADVPQSKMSELDELRRAYPEIDPLMRKTAADGRITQGEYERLTKGPEIVRIKAARAEAEETRVRQSVLQGISPVSTGR